MPVADGLYYFAYERESLGMPPLLLIHGAGGSHLSWPPDIRRLLGHSVYALDLPGHGKSDTFGEQTIAAYAEHVLSWMEAVNLYRMFIIGHSMGGAIALRIAATHPGRVVGLCLLGIGIPFEVPPDIIENLSNTAMVSAAINRIKELSFSQNTPPRIVELVFNRVTEMRASVLRGDYQACMNFKMQDMLKKIEQPTLIIAGAQDQLVPLRYAQLLAKKIKGAELNVIPEAGHMLMLEKPDEIVEHLTSYLQRLEFFP